MQFSLNVASQDTFVTFYEALTNPGVYEIFDVSNNNDQISESRKVEKILVVFQNETVHPDRTNAFAVFTTEGQFLPSEWSEEDSFDRYYMFRKTIELSVTFKN